MRRKRRQNRLGSAVFASIVALPAFFGAFLVYQGAQAEERAPAATTLSSASASAPNQTPDASLPVRQAPETTQNVAPSMLEIDSVNIEAPVVEGSNVNGYMELPRSDKVAEYSGAASLEPPVGSTVIAGHVNYADGSEGAVGDLDKVRKGDTIEVSDEQGQLYEFEVTRSHRQTAASPRHLPRHRRKAARRCLPH